MLKRALVFFILFSLAHLHAQQSAQTKTSTFNDIKIVLEDQWISNLTQDRKGFMWAATQDGLYKYNGKNFKAYRYNPLEKNSIPGSWIRVIKQDQDDILWIGTYSVGLVKFDEKKGSFEKVQINSKNPNLNPLSIYDIFISSSSSVWVATDDGLYRKSKSDSDFVKFKESTASVKILELENGRELIAFKNALYRYNSNEEQLEPVLRNIIINQIESIGHNEIIYTSENELYLYDFINTPKKIDLPNQDAITFMSNVKDSTCIIAGANGSYVLNTKTKSFQTYNYNLESFKSLGISNLFIDRQNLLWVGTQKGLFKESVLNKVFTSQFDAHARRILVDSTNIYITGIQGFFKVPKSNPSNYQQFLKGVSIISICKTDKGFWLGDLKKSIYFIDKNYKIKTITLNEGKIENLRIFGIVEDSNNFIWISTWQGIYVIDDKGNTINTYKLDETKMIKITKLIIDKHDNLWAITAGEGLYKIPNISKLDKNQNHIDYKKYVHNKHDLSSINSDVVLDIHTSQNGTIWIGSDFGLNFYNAEKDNFEPLKVNGKIFDKKIMAMETDANNLLWISTINNGIYVYNDVSETLFNLQEEDGLISNSCLYTSSAIYKEELYFGTDEGVQFINTSKFTYPNVKNVPSFAEMTIQGEFAKTFRDLTHLEQPITLNYNQNSFNINLEIADSRFPEKINYYYKLDETTNFWTKAEGNIISLNKLNYGKYNLLVKAAYQATDNSPISTLALKINPPWHKSIMAYFLLFLGLAIALFSFFQLRYKQKIASNKLKANEELDLIKSNLFTNISHELRTPLTLISGPIEKQLSKGNLKLEDREELNLVKQNADRLLNLVNQLTDLSLIDAGQIKLKIEQGNLGIILKQLVSAFQFKAKEKDIRIQSTITGLDTCWFDRDIIEKISSNLLSNAIKYAPKNTTIIIDSNNVNHTLVLSVINVNTTISKKDFEKLFQRFYQDNEASDGVGVGLALVKELVNLSKGNITANTIDQDKVQFTVSLPLRKNAFSSSEIKSETRTLTTLQTLSNTINKNADDDPLLLIVEDDKDIRAFVVSIFKDSYQILEAENGKTGTDLALQHIPDIIISDVMMPIKNGIELCNTLKYNELTSHIPIILLTAKVGEVNEIEGLKTGADAYITKPFNREKLKLRVEKLIENRQQLQKHFSKDFTIRPDLPITSTEGEFLKRLKVVLDKQITDPDFTSEAFAEAMLMSRTQLHRKLKAIIGMTTSEFIRSQRLKLAIGLLQKSDATVSEIAYQVGFNTPSYFIKCFKEVYNCTPTEYISVA